MPSPQSVSFAFQDPSGAPLAFGKVLVRLQQDVSANVALGPQISAGRVITVALDSNGTATVDLYPAASYTPSMPYNLEAYSAEGQLCWSGTLSVTES
jgi:hypothetical protein